MTSNDPSAPSWLFVPGTLCDARVLGPLRAALGAAGLGLPAHVLPALDSTSRAELAQRLVAKAAGRFYVVAFSLGCQIAFEIMRTYPDRCCGLVLISTTARADDPSVVQTRRDMVQDFERLGSAHLITSRLWHSYVATPDKTDPTVRDLILDMACETGVSTFANQIELAISRPSSLADLSCFAPPVLMINGSHDTLTPPELGKEIAAAAGDGTHRIVPNGGHFVLLEKPKETAGYIHDWLKHSDQ